MYLVRTDVRVRGDFHAGFEAGQAKLGEGAKSVPGFLGATLLHSYSHPNKYTVTARSQNVEAAWGVYKSDAFATWLKSNPPGAVTVLQNEGYESVFEVTTDGAQPGSATCETLVDRQVNPGAAGAFERSRREWFELRKKHVKGFVSSRLRVSGGTPGKYLIIHIYTDVEAARAANSAPELRAWLQDHPNSLYSDAPAVFESYKIVHLIGA
jgi:antibiotic biosynthesis monooxygenase (ABM) superfamily enzyme